MSDSNRVFNFYRRCARTNYGQAVLNFIEGSLNLICKAMAPKNKVKVEAAALQSLGSKFQKRTENLMDVSL